MRAVVHQTSDRETLSRLKLPDFLADERCRLNSHQTTVIITAGELLRVASIHRLLMLVLPAIVHLPLSHSAVHSTVHARLRAAVRQEQLVRCPQITFSLVGQSFPSQMSAPRLAPVRVLHRRRRLSRVHANNLVR